VDVHLLLGGARSGKSSTAQRLVESRELEPVYLATALVDPGDAEFVARVDKHRADRGPAWTTVEEPRDLVGALRRHRRPGTGLVVDCLTLWLSTALEEERDLGPELDALCAELAAGEGLVVLVSNEVGLGLVPMHPVGRAFRDAQGRVNQRVAAVADHVALLVAGLPLVLRGDAPPTAPARPG